MTVKDVNDELAAACQKCGAACCKKGKIFLPRDEYRRIRRHVQALGPDETTEFDSRITDHGLFFLYDQRNGCQFLDVTNLCRLHDLGLKPTECFWWPYHVFAAGTGDLEVRLYTACCDAHETHTEDSTYPGLIAGKAGHIGFDVIRAFRQVHGGSVDTKLVGRIEASSTEPALDASPGHEG